MYVDNNDNINYSNIIIINKKSSKIALIIFNQNVTNKRNHIYYCEYIKKKRVDKKLHCFVSPELGTSDVNLHAIKILKTYYANIEEKKKIQ